MKQPPSKRSKVEKQLPETVLPYMKMKKRDLADVLLTYTEELSSLLSGKIAKEDAGASEKGGVLWNHMELIILSHRTCILTPDFLSSMLS